MGITINEAITWLNTDDYESKGFAEATSVAIDIMRKYEKIKEQVDIAIDKENFAISDARLIQIREIINGNS